MFEFDVYLCLFNWSYTFHLFDKYLLTDLLSQPDVTI